MFGHKSNQNNLATPPPPPPANPINHGMASPSLSSSLDFTSQAHPTGPQQLTSVRIKEPFGKIFIIFTTITLIAVLAGTGYLFFSKKKIESEIVGLTAQKATLMAEYSKPQNTTLISSSQDIVNRLKDFDKILNKRIEWIKILKEFNRETLKNTVYTDVSMSADGTMQLTGQTPDDNTFAKVFRAWESSEIIKSITVSSFAKQESTEGLSSTSALGIPNYINFSLSLSLKPELIYPNTSKTNAQTPASTAAPAQTQNSATPSSNTNSTK